VVVPPVVVRPHGFGIAPLWRRFLARVIDFFVVLALNLAVNAWFVYQWWMEISPVIGEYWRRSLANESTSDLAGTQRSSTLLIIIIVLAAALWFAYEVPSVGNTGQTLGKKLLGIKVMRMDSTEAIGYRRSIRRWNPLGLPTLLWTCGVGFVLQLVDSLSPLVDWPLHRAFHDRSAGTIVVHIGQPGRSGSPASSTGPAGPVNGGTA
jgi:uncharacterized RDD family membrane protein YckC